MTPYLPKGLGILAVLAASTAAMPVAAQYNNGNDVAQTVRCDSNDNRHRSAPPTRR